MNTTTAAPPRIQRICVVAERMSDPLDEGGRKFACLLASALERHATVRKISVGGAKPASNGHISVPRTRTFTARTLRHAVRDFQPDTVCYVPEASMTLFSVMRGRFLKLAFPRTRLALIALQTRTHSAAALPLLRLLRPDLVVALSRHTANAAAKLGCRTAVIPPAVDLDRFRPVDAGQKAALRRKYGLDEKAFLVLHVGHVKRERGVGLLGELGPACQAVLVAARSEGADPGLVERLRQRHVVVIDDFLPDIHELYQAADCYLFPVLQEDASIDAPLSVLEAMACNLPVATTPFGSLPDLMPPGKGLLFATTARELTNAVSNRGWMAAVDTRSLVSHYSWDNAARSLLNAIEAVQ